jgi:hypothetical protein
MKLTHSPKFGALALSGTLSLLAVAASSAALVAPLTPEIPGVALGAAVNNLGGTVIADQTVPFISASTPTIAFTGSLRSTVVRNAGGNLDFYYQLANTTSTTVNPVDPEIFRLTLNGFDPRFSTSGTSYDVSVISNGLTGITGSGAFSNGTNAAFSADRQVGILNGGIGFDFGDDRSLVAADTTPPFTNLLANQTSNFLVVRTTAKEFTDRQALVFGAASAFTHAFTPIPEPATALVGLALASFIGCAELGRKRRRTTKA